MCFLILRHKEHAMQMLGHDLQDDRPHIGVVGGYLLPTIAHTLPQGREVNNGFTVCCRLCGLAILSFFLLPSERTQKWFTTVRQGNGEHVDASAFVVVTIHAVRHGVVTVVAPSNAFYVVKLLVCHGEMIVEGR